MSIESTLPATRVWWYDIDNHYHSITTTNSRRAARLVTSLRTNGLRAGITVVS